MGKVSSHTQKGKQETKKRVAKKQFNARTRARVCACVSG